MARSGWFGYCRNIVSVLALLVTANSAFTQALPTETTGSLAFYGYTTKKVRPADLFIVDFTSTPTITGVVYSTTTTINVDPGDPWTFDSYTTGVDLRGTDGTWNVDGELFIANTGLSDEITSPPNSGGWPIAIPDDLTSTVIIKPQAVQYEWEDTDLMTTLTTVYGAPYFVIQHAQPSHLFTNKPVAYDFQPQYLVIHPAPDIGDADTPELYGASDYPTTIGRNIDLTGDVTADGGFNTQSGPIITSTGYVNAGSGFSTPQVITISTIAGGIASDYVGVDEDLHVGDGSYLANGCVVGRGAQDHSQDGSLWLETAGSFTAPYAGYQEARIYTDQQGIMVQTNHGSANQGSISNAFRTNADVMTSRSLITSNTLSLEGSSYEGQATIAITDSNAVVSTSLISSGDVVLLTYPGDDGGGGALWAESITPATEFIIQATNTVSTDTLVNWKIIK